MQLEISHHEYAAYGQCIYCGSTIEPLTTEHIIPFGMYGRLSIPKASCEVCRLETHKFETNVQSKFLRFYRYGIGIPSRKGRKRPATFSVEVKDPENPEARVTEQIPIEYAPRLLCLPVFGEPMFWKNDGKYPDTYWSIWMAQDDVQNLHKFTKKKTSIKFEMHRKSFLRTVCKIAHSYLFGAVKNKGVLKGYSPLLVDYIRFETAEPQYYVGSQIEAYSKTYDFHTLDVIRLPHGSREYLVVKVRLFAYLEPQPPSYYAVTAYRDLPR